MRRPPDGRRSVRLPAYDYAAPGAYFVTICAANRALLFGTVIDGLVRLSHSGRTAADLWRLIPEARPGVDLDAFVVMPNHLHGIVVIGEQAGDAGGEPDDPDSRAQRPDPGAPLARPYRADGGERRFGPLPAGSLSVVVNQYQGRVTKALGGPVWQRGFYEHVIRDEAGLERVRAYIAENPLRWPTDGENPDRLVGRR